MNISQEIKNKINKHYEGAYINYADLSNHLMLNRIDSSEPIVKHNGYDKPFNELYPIVFYYEDNSMLIITGNTVVVANKNEE